MNINVLLYAPEYRPNLSNMIRTVEFFGLKNLYIYDANHLMQPPKNKASRAEMNHLARVWTAGAIEHITLHTVENVTDFLAEYAGRKLATFLDPKATHLANFEFMDGDLLIMGPEKEGLPIEIAQRCDAQLYIPSLGQTSCLNVSASLGVFLYAAQQQRAK